MANLITMPSLSPTMETGIIATWTKKVGDHIEVGEVLAEIETDKAVMEFEMVDEGYIRAFLVELGQELAVGTPIAILAESMDEDISAMQAQAGAAPAPQAAAPAPAPAAAAAPPAAPAAAAAPQPPAAPPPPPPAPAAPAAHHGGNGSGERVRISPFARKLAAERSIDIHGLQGTGPGGRIVAKDLEGASASSPASSPVAAPAAGGAAPAHAPAPFVPGAAQGPAYEDLPLGMMRKAIARKMIESKTTAPHFQVTRKVRAEGLLNGRAMLKERFPDFKVTVNDILIKAVAMALRHHPTINSQFLDDRIRRFHTVDVAVAVGTDDGLITPIIRNTDMKGLVQISGEMKELAAKARERRLAPEDYTGGTFSISNLGMYGVTEFNAIINTPQACILAVAGVVEEPVVEKGALAVGKTMNMTLSSDHRVVDGLAAAQFMETLVQMLENPLAILL